MNKAIVAALDLGYLRTGFAVVEQPGDIIHGHEVLRAIPARLSKDHKESDRCRRARSAFDSLRLALEYAINDFGLDAVVFEEPQWIGARLKQRGTSKEAVLALGQALERMYLALSVSGWISYNGTEKLHRRPIYSIDPNRWQPLFTGVTSQQMGAGKMKDMVLKRLKERTGLALSPKQHDAADAIAIGLVAGTLILEGKI